MNAVCGIARASHVAKESARCFGNSGEKEVQARVRAATMNTTHLGLDHRSEQPPVAGPRPSSPAAQRTPNVTLADLPQYDCRVGTATPQHEVAAVLRSQPDLPGV